MELRRRAALAALVACALALWLVPGHAWAATPSVGVGPIDAVTKAVVDSAKGWIPVLQNYARGVFVGLAVIQMAWIGVRHALSGSPDIGGAMGAAALEFVTLGFFAVLISEGPGWAEAIVLSLQEAGRVAAGGQAGQTPQQILDEIAALGVKVIEDLSLLNAITSGLAMAIGCIGLLLLTALIAGLILVGWVQAWVVVGAGSILLGLGGSTWTRSLATNYLRHALGAGVKLMVLELLSGVLLGHVKAWVDEANAGDAFSLELLVHVLLSLTVMAIMILTVPSYVSSIVTGAVMNGGEAMLTRAVAAAAIFTAGKAMGASRAGAASGSGAGQATTLGGMEAPATSAPGLMGGGTVRATGGGAAPTGARAEGIAASRAAPSVVAGSAGADGSISAPEAGAGALVAAPAGTPAADGSPLGTGGLRSGPGGNRRGGPPGAAGLNGAPPRAGGGAGGAVVERSEEAAHSNEAIDARRAPGAAGAGRSGVPSTKPASATAKAALAEGSATDRGPEVGPSPAPLGTPAGSPRAAGESAGERRPAGGGTSGVMSAAPGLARRVGDGSVGTGGVAPKASPAGAAAPSASGGVPGGSGSPGSASSGSIGGGARTPGKPAGSARGAAGAAAESASIGADGQVRTVPAPRASSGARNESRGSERGSSLRGAGATRLESAMSGDDDGEEESGDE